MRTTHRSTAGKKLYAVRDGSGQIQDIQTYERAHGQDVKRHAKDEKPSTSSSKKGSSSSSSRSGSR